MSQFLPANPTLVIDWYPVVPPMESPSIIVRLLCHVNTSICWLYHPKIVGWTAQISTISLRYSNMPRGNPRTKWRLDQKRTRQTKSGIFTTEKHSGKKRHTKSISFMFSHQIPIIFFPKKKEPGGHPPWHGDVHWRRRCWWRLTAAACERPCGIWRRGRRSWPGRDGGGRWAIFELLLI